MDPTGGLSEFKVLALYLPGCSCNSECGCVIFFRWAERNKEDSHCAVTADRWVGTFWTNERLRLQISCCITLHYTSSAVTWKWPNTLAHARTGTHTHLRSPASTSISQAAEMCASTCSNVSWTCRTVPASSRAHMTLRRVWRPRMRARLVVSDLLKVPAGAATDGEQPVLIKTRLLIIGRLRHNEVTERLEVAADIRTSEQSRGEYACIKIYGGCCDETRVWVFACMLFVSCDKIS